MVSSRAGALARFKAAVVCLASSRPAASPLNQRCDHHGSGSEERCCGSRLEHAHGHAREAQLSQRVQQLTLVAAGNPIRGRGAIRGRGVATSSAAAAAYVQRDSEIEQDVVRGWWRLQLSREGTRVARCAQPLLPQAL